MHEQPDHRSSGLDVPSRASRYGYDPAFMLPFTMHTLDTGAVTASDISSQGLLAMAIMALCSDDEAMRSTGYSILASYVDKAALQHFREKPALLALVQALQSTELTKRKTTPNQMPCADD